MIVKVIDQRGLLIEGSLLWGLEDFMVGKGKAVSCCEIRSCIVKVTYVDKEVRLELTDLFKSR